MKIKSLTHTHTNTRNIYASNVGFEEMQSYKSVVNSNTLTHIVDAAQKSELRKKKFA